MRYLDQSEVRTEYESAAVTDVRTVRGSAALLECTFFPRNYPAEVVRWVRDKVSY